MLVQILNGLVYGGLLYIVSVGLVLIFGLRRIVNFAHGSLFMIGAYVGFSVAAIAGYLGGHTGSGDRAGAGRGIARRLDPAAAAARGPDCHRAGDLWPVVDP